MTFKCSWKPNASENVLFTLYYIFNLVFEQNNYFAPFAGKHIFLSLLFAFKWFWTCLIIESKFGLEKQDINYCKWYFKCFGCKERVNMCWKLYITFLILFSCKTNDFYATYWQNLSARQTNDFLARWSIYTQTHICFTFMRI